ncbi:MAG TPA: tetratricopeptide repeat protein [Thermoanaerobaculia bacterium]|nr:tetratricopeptide repeat protein [Thermoanaerobaculia bacterium]
MGKRRAAVLIGVHLVFLAHLAHWLTKGKTLGPVEPSEAMAFGQNAVVNAGLIFFGLAILSTALFGRFFCGWGCHIVALQDLSRWALEKVGIRPKPLRSRWLAWVPAVAFFYMFLWPATYRIATGLGFPKLTTQLATTNLWATFPGALVGGLTFVVCGFFCVYLLGAKGFCTYACPYGAIFGVMDRIAPGRIRVTDACSGCGHCTAVCTSNVRVHAEVASHGMVIDPGCMKCMDCISVCPNDALYFGFGKPSLGAEPRAAVEPRRRELGRGDELFLVATFALAFFALRGLYGAFPFLYTLGIAAVLAFVAWTVRRLTRDANLSLRGLQLRRAGRLRPAGYASIAVAAVLAAGWAHCAAVQTALQVGEWRYARLDAARATAFGAKPPAVTPKERSAAEAAQRWLGRARRWGALPQPQLDLPIAWAAYFAGDEDAIAERARTLASDGGDAGTAWSLLAKSAERRGATPAAVAAYRNAIDAAPDDARAYLALGLLLANGGDLSGAGDAFASGLARAPHDADLAYNLGVVEAMRGNIEAAIGRFRQALAAAPGHVAARENLAAALAELERARAPR